jgi:hypothetical protein
MVRYIQPSSAPVRVPGPARSHLCRHEETEMLGSEHELSDYDNAGNGTRLLCSFGRNDYRVWRGGSTTRYAAAMGVACSRRQQEE